LSSLSNPFDENHFVGIKCGNSGIKVWFPVGFELGRDDNELRRNVLSLLQTLSNFTDRTDSEWKKESFDEHTDFLFIHIYLL
jgi:hypothetical protein